MQTAFDAQYFGSDLLSAVSSSSRVGPFGTVWNQAGVVCLLVPWSQISDPLAGLQCCSPCSSQLTALSSQTCLSVIMTPSLAASAHLVCLLLFLHPSVCLSALFIFFCLSSVCHIITNLSLSLSLSDLLLAPGRWRRQHKLSLESDHTEDDSYEKFPTLIKGLSFKHCCLRETNSYCHMKIADFPSFASLFWFLN